MGVEVLVDHAVAFQIVPHDSVGRAEGVLSIILYHRVAGVEGENRRSAAVGIHHIRHNAVLGSGTVQQEDQGANAERDRNDVVNAHFLQFDVCSEGHSSASGEW